MFLKDKARNEPGLIHFYISAFKQFRITVRFDCFAYTILKHGKHSGNWHKISVFLQEKCVII